MGIEWYVWWQVAVLCFMSRVTSVLPVLSVNSSSSALVVEDVWPYTGRW